MQTVIHLVAVALLCVFLGCSDNNPVNGDSHNDAERPLVPEPTSYAGTVPATSNEVIVKKVLLSDYSPYVIGATPNGSSTGSAYYNGVVYQWSYSSDSLYTAWKQGDSTGILPERLDLLVNGQVMNYVYLNWFMCPNPDPGYRWVRKNAKPLSSKPELQLVRYWVRIGSVERYSGNTSKTITTSTIHGTTEKSASEFSKTLGIEASVSGSWYVDLELKVKSEFSWTETHETSIMREETFEESFTISCPENKNIVYCVWQLYEEYRIVGADGELFADPNYLFDNEYNRSVFPTDELVPMTTYFDN